MARFIQIYRQLGTDDDLLARWGLAVLLLALRVWIGWQFFHAGMLKLADWPATLDLFSDEYHVPWLPPQLAALAGTGGELLFPLLLAPGLLARPAAFGLFCVNLMAVISYPQLWQFECPAAIQSHFYWGAGLLILAVGGAGRLSVDYGLLRLTQAGRRLAAHGG